MFQELEILKRLVNEGHVQLNVLAEMCHCSVGSIFNYINGVSMPSGSKILNLREGLKQYKEMINNIIQF